MKPRVFNSDSLTNGRFPKGHVPWCTGTKGILKANSGSFRKGMLPRNLEPVGTIKTRQRYNRPVPPSRWIKVSECPNRWQELSRYNYEKHIGPIPDGMLVSFKDGNTLNCEPYNLELVSRADMARRNYNLEKVIATRRRRRETKVT